MRCRGEKYISSKTHLVTNSLEVFVDLHSVTNEAASERVEDKEIGLEVDEDEERKPEPPADLLVAHHVPDSVAGQHQELVVNRVSLLEQIKVKTNPEEASTNPVGTLM